MSSLDISSWKQWFEAKDLVIIDQSKQAALLSWFDASVPTEELLEHLEKEGNTVFKTRWTFEQWGEQLTLNFDNS